MLSESSPDFLLLQETKLDPLLSFPNFHGYKSHHAPNRRGEGGTAIYYKEGIKSRNRCSGVGGVDFVSAEFRTAYGWITIASIYVHPGGARIERLVAIFDSPSPCIAGGDFNARHPTFGDESSN